MGRCKKGYFEVSGTAPVRDKWWLDHFRLGSSCSFLSLLLYSGVLVSPPAPLTVCHPLYSGKQPFHKKKEKKEKKTTALFRTFFWTFLFSIITATITSLPRTVTWARTTLRHTTARSHVGGPFKFPLTAARACHMELVYRTVRGWSRTGRTQWLHPAPAHVYGGPWMNRRTDGDGRECTCPEETHFSRINVSAPNRSELHQLCYMLPQASEECSVHQCDMTPRTEKGLDGAAATQETVSPTRRFWQWF